MKACVSVTHVVSRGGWDWLFGSLYVPKNKEPLSIDIRKEDIDRMQRIYALHIEPFKDAYG